jgi:hypothetical protein
MSGCLAFGRPGAGLWSDSVRLCSFGGCLAFARPGAGLSTVRSFGGYFGPAWGQCGAPSGSGY